MAIESTAITGSVEALPIAGAMVVKRRTEVLIANALETFPTDFESFLGFVDQIKAEPAQLRASALGFSAMAHQIVGARRAAVFTILIEQVQGIREFQETLTPELFRSAAEQLDHQKSYQCLGQLALLACTCPGRYKAVQPIIKEALEELAYLSQLHQSLHGSATMHELWKAGRFPEVVISDARRNYDLLTAVLSTAPEWKGVVGSISADTAHARRANLVRKYSF